MPPSNASGPIPTVGRGVFHTWLTINFAFSASKFPLFLLVQEPDKRKYVQQSNENMGPEPSKKIVRNSPEYNKDIIDISELDQQSRAQNSKGESPPKLIIRQAL